MCRSIQDDLNEVHDSETCPKCKGSLEYDSGATMESEKYYCEGCNTLYEVQVELVRFWETLEEVEK